MNKQTCNRSVFFYSALFALTTILLAGCATLHPTRQNVVNQPRLAEGVYLSSNIHAEARNGHLLASYANWTDTEIHRVIPVNTQVDIHEWDHGFAIVALDNERRPVIFEYDERRMQMRVEEYIEKITSVQETDLNELSEVDREGIEKGEAMVGMSKEGVRIALGFPARHETPSLDDDTWTYWRNRWARYNVIFDQDGEVTAIQD